MNTLNAIFVLVFLIINSHSLYGTSYFDSIKNSSNEILYELIQKEGSKVFFNKDTSTPGQPYRNSFYVESKRADSTKTIPPCGQQLC